MSTSHTLIIGSGISAIVTAFTLVKAGHAITLLSHAPDPRISNDFSIKHGATWGSECTRCVTPFESHSFLAPSPLHPTLDQAFTTSLQEGGWLIQPIEHYDAQEQAWLHARQHYMATSDAHHEANNIHSILQTRGMALWQTWRDTLPSLFAGTQCRDTALNIYATKEQYDYAAHLHKENNSLQTILQGNALLQHAPFLAEAIDNNTIYGALITEGFSFDNQQFILNCLDYIEQQNNQSVFHFSCPAHEILYDCDHAVCGIRAGADNTLFTANHYSLHLGAYDTHNLLDTTPAANALHGIAGRWLKLPIEPEDGITSSLKCHISEHDHAHHVNLALWQDPHSGQYWLICGAGHAYVGRNPLALSNADRALLDTRNHNAVKRFFPHLYRRAYEQGTLVHSNKECIRSWTANDIPLCLSMPTDTGGKLIISGGAGTGTASLAPADAERIYHAIYT